MTKSSMMRHQKTFINDPTTQSNINLSSLKNLSVRKTRRIFTILHKRSSLKKPRLTPDLPDSPLSSLVLNRTNDRIFSMIEKSTSTKSNLENANKIFKNATTL